MTELTRYMDNMGYLPEQEREALQELAIAENRVDSIPEAIIRRISESRKGMV